MQGGEVVDRTSVGRAWAGDKQAYEFFQARYHEWPSTTEVPFRLLSAMQFLVTYDVASTVGGYVMRVATTPDGFRFVPDPSVIGPWRTEVSEVRFESGFVELALAVPEGGDTTSYSIEPIAGRPPTSAALAYFIPETRIALLFTADSPWSPVRVEGRSLEEIIDRAAVEHGQLLAQPQFRGPISTA